MNYQIPIIFLGIFEIKECKILNLWKIDLTSMIG